jgi:tyrosine-protein kinase Etk/Wzc
LPKAKNAPRKILNHEQRFKGYVRSLNQLLLRLKLMNTSMPSRHESLIDILKVLVAQKKLIRNITLATLVGSIVISLLLPNYYRSATSFYPASPDLANPEQLFGNTGNITNYFGNEHDLDRLLEIANSEDMVRFMIDSFQLYQHYDIDQNDAEGTFDVRKKFRKLYSVEKNKFDAIEIAIEDKDRTRCAPMINAAREKVNEIAQKLTKKSQRNLLTAFEKNMADKQLAIAVLNDSIEQLKNQYGIYDVGTQSGQLGNMATYSRTQVIQTRAILESLEADENVPRDTIAFIKARLKGYESYLKSLEATGSLSASGFNKGSQVIQVLQDLHYQARKQLSYDIERYNQIKATYNTQIQALHVIQVGEPPLKKSRPTRSVLVIAATLAAFLFTCLGILFRESFKDISWRQLNNAY